MGKYREITAELLNTFPNDWHTPAWRQIHLLTGHPLGCGPTAWGIVYGYWSAFKGKKKLFDRYDVHANYNKTPSRDSGVAKAIGQISNDTDTNYGGEVINSRFGLTWPKNMCNGIKYARSGSVGYRNAKCTRVRHPSEYSKFWKIYKHIKADRPVILLIKAKGGAGFVNHYVVVEKAILKQKKVMGKWKDRDVSYLVNFGHGPAKGKHKQIWVREKGKNRHKIYPCGSAYLISL